MKSLGIHGSRTKHTNKNSRDGNLKINNPTSVINQTLTL